MMPVRKPMAVGLQLHLQRAMRLLERIVLP